MPPRKVSSKAHLGYKSANKHRRQDFAIKRKKALDILQREKRFERKKLEAKNPELRETRLAENKPITIDSKRKYDSDGEEGEDILSRAVDLAALAKRRKLEELADLEEDLEDGDAENGDAVAEDREADEVPMKEVEEESDADSMLGDSEDEEEHTFKKPALPTRRRASSPNPSTTSTVRTDLTPEALAAKFPSLFDETTTEPKVLITTSLGAQSIHKEAQVLEEVFHNSVYVRRQSHRFGHKVCFSI
jgi:ribosome production factor 1